MNWGAASEVIPMPDGKLATLNIDPNLVDQKNESREGVTQIDVFDADRNHVVSLMPVLRQGTNFVTAIIPPEAVSIDGNLIKVAIEPDHGVTLNTEIREEVIARGYLEQFIRDRYGKAFFAEYKTADATYENQRSECASISDGKKKQNCERKSDGSFEKTLDEIAKRLKKSGDEHATMYFFDNENAKKMLPTVAMVYDEDRMFGLEMPNQNPAFLFTLDGVAEIRHLGSYFMGGVSHEFVYWDLSTNPYMAKY